MPTLESDSTSMLYDELTARSREAAVIGSCAAVLGWDEQTYMPPGAAAHRGEQAAALAGLQHDRGVDPRIGELLDALESAGVAAEDSIRGSNVRNLRRDYDRRTRLPRDLVEALARTTSLAQQAWIAARKKSDFESFRPWLEQVLALKRRESACLLEVVLQERRSGPRPEHPEDAPAADAGATIYDPLLDQYEPGAETVRLRALFAAIRDELSPLVREIAEASRKREATAGKGGGASILERSYPVDRQRVLCEQAAQALGFDFDRGRLDVSAHPFCTGIGPGDVRTTTRFDPEQFSDAFFGVLHEVGHGLYEQGLPVEQYGAPAGEAASLGVHESQSRLWENAVGRSLPFWTYWFPIARRTFHEALRDVSLDQFLAAVNHVEPSLIRVQADEATYNLHILIRFELEQALLTGDLPVAELPAAWNARYADLLGVVPATDAEGCLQDVHWSAGLFGYFPTYTLGNLYAAQLFARARADLPGLDPSFSRGDFSELLAWLRDAVHRHGRRYAPADLIERAVAAPLDHRPLMDSLRRKYGALYGI